jgi:hypothetical protein
MYHHKRTEQEAVVSVWEGRWSPAGSPPAVALASSGMASCRGPGRFGGSLGGEKVGGGRDKLRMDSRVECTLWSVCRLLGQCMHFALD